MNILQVDKVTKHFGDLAAVQNVSFELEKGEILGIAGPNGSGKTTLFNLISGFYRCDSGIIFFNNKKISGLETHQICQKGIARIFQIPNLFLTISVRRNIKVGAYFGGSGQHDKEKLINDVIHFVGLEGKEDIIVSNINLLDKKLTMLATALVTNPEILLLDEPIGGLSPVEVEKFIKLIRKANQKKNLTIIIIEHLMRILTDLSQRMIILYNGEKICEGPPNRVVNDKKVVEVYLGSN